MAKKKKSKKKLDRYIAWSISELTKKGNHPKGKYGSVQILAEPSMGCSYRNIAKFPDPYAEFGINGFDLVDFYARIFRRAKTNRIFKDELLQVEIVKKEEIDFRCGNFGTHNTRFIKKCLKHIQTTYSPTKRTIVEWMIFRAKDTKDLLLFDYENSLEPTRFVCRGLNMVPVNKDNLEYIKKLTKGFATPCIIGVKKKYRIAPVCLTE